MQVSPLKEVLYGSRLAHLATQCMALIYDMPQSTTTHRSGVASSLFSGFLILRQINNLHYSHILETKCATSFENRFTLDCARCTLSNSDYNPDSYFGKRQRQREQVDVCAVTEPSLQTVPIQCTKKCETHKDTRDTESNINSAC